MYIRIHPGAADSGCTTEIICRDRRILIDLAAGTAVGEAGLMEGTADVDGVFFTHFHGDHIGKWNRVLPEIPLYIGAEAKKNMESVAAGIVYSNSPVRNRALQMIGKGKVTDRFQTYVPLRPITVGPFTVTAYPMDHDAFDAFMLRIDTPEGSILYTGEFREQGYLGVALERSLVSVRERGPIDYIVTDGTMLDRPGTETSDWQDKLGKKSYDLQLDITGDGALITRAQKIFQAEPYAFILMPSTAFSELAALSEGRKRNDRLLLVDRYVLSQLNLLRSTTGRRNKLYQFAHAYQFAPASQSPGKGTGTQADLAKETGFVALLNTDGPWQEEIETYRSLNPVLIYTPWEGYRNSSPVTNDLCGRFKKQIHLHSHSHAPLTALQKVLQMLPPQKALIPLHGEDTALFDSLGLSVPVLSAAETPIEL